MSLVAGNGEWLAALPACYLANPAMASLPVCGANAVPCCPPAMSPQNGQWDDETGEPTPRVGGGQGSGVGGGGAGRLPWAAGGLAVRLGWQAR